MLLGQSGLILTQSQTDSLESLRKSLNSDDPALEKIYHDLMNSYLHFDEYNRWDTTLLQYEAYAQENDIKLSLADVKSLKAYRLMNKGEFKNAITQYQKSIALAKECPDSQNKGIIISAAYQGLGMTFDFSEKYTLARDNFREAIVWANWCNNDFLVAESYNSIGVSFDFEEEYDSALVYFNKALLVGTSYIDHIVRAGIGNTLRDLKQYKNAFDQLILAHEIYESPSAHVKDYIYGYIIAEMGTIIASVDHLSERHERWVNDHGGEQYLLEASLKAGIASKSLETLLKTRPLLSKLYEKNGDFQGSNKLLQDHLTLLSQMHEDRQQEYLAEFEAKYNKSEDEKIILSQEKELVISSKNTSNLLIVLSGLLLIVGIVFFFFVRLRKKQNALVVQKQIVDQSLEEKELLLKEVHHRVKNNLQIISSLLNQQALKSTDETLRSLVDEGQRRIKSMAMIHQKLYQTEDFRNINMGDYTEELTRTISNSMKSADQDIVVHYDIDKTKFNIDLAISLGLILNELITNVYKYAFKGRKSGNVFIGLKEVDEDKHELSVRDDGVGLPLDFEERSKQSLGMSLIKGLSWQLRGDLSYSSDSGSNFMVKFTNLDMA